MKKALGLIEIEGLSSAILVADTMVKAANITLEEIENTKGLGWMTIKVTGDVGAVTAAVNAGKQIGIMHGHFVTAKIIPRPSDFIESFFCFLPKEKLKTPKEEQKKENKKETKEEPKKSRKKTKKLVIKEKQTEKKQTVEEKKLPKEEKNIELVEDNHLEKEILQEQLIPETEKKQEETFEQHTKSSENQNFEQEPSDSENND